MTPWTVARRLLYSENSLGKNTGSVLLFPSPGRLPYPRIKPGSLILQADPLLSEPQNYNSKRYMYSNIHRSTFHNSKIWKQGTKLPTRRSNCQHLLDHRKSKGIKKKRSTSVLLTILKPLTVQITTNWKIQKMGIPDHLTYLLRNLYAGQEATV